MANQSEKDRMKKQASKEDNDDDGAELEEVDEKDKRIFINHIDSYQGSNIARVRSNE